MKCYTVDGTGLEELKLEDRPEPGKPDKDEVLVEVDAVALNYRDLMVADGRYGGAFPRFTAGSDMAGTVSAVGENVTELRVGDRVLNAPFRFWPAGLPRPHWTRTFVGGAGVDGVLAERVSYPAESLVKVPAHLTQVEGSTLTIAGLTAWSAVVTHGRVRSGDWVLTHGTGGVSIFAAQLARLAGARTIMTTSSREKAELVKRELGVAVTPDYRDADWPKQVAEATGGTGVDIVVEVVGGDSLGQSLKACGYGARVGVIGVLDGPQSTIGIRDLLSHQVTVRGIFMESTQELRAFTRAVEAHEVKPYVDKVFPFDDASGAYAYLQSQKHIGKVVIAVREGASG